MGDVWTVPRGPGRGIYYESEADYEAVCRVVPVRPGNADMTGRLFGFDALPIRVATPDEIARFRAALASVEPGSAE